MLAPIFALCLSIIRTHLSAAAQNDRLVLHYRHLSLLPYNRAVHLQARLIKVIITLLPNLFSRDVGRASASYLGNLLPLTFYCVTYMRKALLPLSAALQKDSRERLRRILIWTPYHSNY
jgi:hypothetical protein